MYVYMRACVMMRNVCLPFLKDCPKHVNKKETDPIVSTSCSAQVEGIEPC